MARLLFPASAFQPIAGIEAPVIPSTIFAGFFGDGSFGSRDNQNVAPGGVPFQNIGTGPTLSANYVTIIQVTGSWQTAMIDTGVHTLVFAVQAPPSNSFATIFQYYGAGGAPAPTRLDWLWVSGVPTVRSQGGNLSGGSGSCDCVLSANNTTVWNLIAWVDVIGKPITMYNLTTGVVTQSATPVQSAARPVVGGTWCIGAPVLTAYPDQCRIAFAMGAQTEVSQADLTTLAASLRYPLSRRGILV